MALNLILDLLDSSDEEEPPLKVRHFRDLQHPFDGLSDRQIYDRYRFTPAVIMEITDLIKTDIEHPTKRNRSIPALHQTCVMLRYLASNSFKQVIGDTLNIDKSTCCRIFHNCLRSLIKHLPQLIVFPTDEEIIEIKKKFYSMKEFPNVIGAIDGTHIKIKPPEQENYVYINRKGFKSLNVQGVCDASGLFTHINAAWPGSTHDSRIFKESGLFEYLEQNPTIGHLLGDSGYACRPYLLTPYLHPENAHEIKYNVAHKSTRVLIKQVFGRWKRRFYILASEIRINYKWAPLIIVCCAMLHNLAVKRRLPNFGEDEKIENGEEINVNNDFQSGLHYRDYVANSFFLIE